MTQPNEGPGIGIDRDEHVVRVTLDRPERHNALGIAEVRRLEEIFDEVEQAPDVRALVITGAGDRTFCAGASLDEMERGDMSGEIFDALTDRLAALPVPTVCALNGDAYGGGAEIALCCDFRLGVHDLRLAVPAARLGVCYPVGGLTRYVTRLGLPTASRILLAAETLDADELVRVGFLGKVVAPHELRPETDALLQRLSVLAPMAVRSMKAIMVGVSAGTLDREEADRLVAACNASDDLAEGLAARRERRSPDFRGQ